MSLDFMIVDVFSDRPSGGNQLGVFPSAEGISDATMNLFAGECPDGARLYARMFAPALGVDEDPATGSASAALVASLAADAPLADGSYRIQIDQGVGMGRPGLIEATVRKEQGRLAEVSVGGYATIIGHGVITLGG